MNTSGFVLKTKYVADKSDLQKKIRDTSGLFKNIYYNSKITEIESKIPTISGLATNAPLTTVGNKIAKIRKLVKKTNQNTKSAGLEKKLGDHDHDKYIATPEFTNLATRFFTARLAQANLATKTDFDNKLKSPNQKNNSNQTKHLVVENE